jgi:hypothetical protein
MKGDTDMSVSQRLQRLLRFSLPLLLTAGVLIFLAAHPALAQVSLPGGQDNTRELGPVLDLFKTLQGFGFNVVARVIGGVLVIMGLSRVAMRDFLSGCVAIFGGSSLFFAEKIADTLSKLAGG